jgi:hypothetical protein
MRDIWRQVGQDHGVGGMVDWLKDNVIRNVVLIAFTDKWKLREHVLLFEFVAHVLKLDPVKCHIVSFRQLHHIF